MRDSLDLRKISDIALLFLDGDSLENVMVDRLGHTDYHFDRFNALKRTLLQVEKIAPALGVSTPYSGSLTPPTGWWAPLWWPAVPFP